MKPPRQQALACPAVRLWDVGAQPAGLGTLGTSLPSQHLNLSSRHKNHKSQNWGVLLSGASPCGKSPGRPHFGGKNSEFLWKIPWTPRCVTPGPPAPPELSPPIPGKASPPAAGVPRGFFLGREEAVGAGSAWVGLARGEAALDELSPIPSLCICGMELGFVGFVGFVGWSCSRPGHNPWEEPGSLWPPRFLVGFFLNKPHLPKKRVLGEGKNVQEQRFPHSCALHVCIPTSVPPAR